MSKLFIQLIRGYQIVLSPVFGQRCRYYPTCSQYTLEAIRTHGAVKGCLLGAWRILRCNPFSAGGIDHVPPKGHWHTHATGQVN